MKIADIKIYVLQGKQVYWKSENYIVIQDSIGQWLIKCISNNDVVGIESASESDFYMKD